MKYTMKQKNERNTRLYTFWLNHQTWTYKSIGKQFKISASRVCRILKTERLKPFLMDEGYLFMEARKSVNAGKKGK
jgi:hypothetical protein